jgi:glycosyltransferase involved in cell wall biosynthesis
MDILVQRQLDNMATGNCAYLETFLRMVKSAGLEVRIIFAPFQSFGNRPWATIHPRFEAMVSEFVWPGTVKVKGRYWSISPRVWGRFAQRILKEGWKRLGGKLFLPSYLGRQISLTEARIMAEICDARPADITVAEYSSMAPALKYIYSKTIHACLMHDLLSARTDRFREGDQPLELGTATLEAELEWLSSCDLIFFASVNELEALRPKLPKARMVWVAPDAPEYGPIDNSASPRVVFIGTVHGGNIEALNHFLADVWPHIHAEQPDLEFQIAGSIGNTLTAQQASQPGVKVLGRVDKLESLGGPNSIGIAPTRFASGVSIKVAEYLLLEMPVVAYPLALEGFGPVLNDIVVVTEGPEALKSAILKLVRDPSLRAELSANAKAKAPGRLSHAAPVQTIRETLELAGK